MSKTRNATDLSIMMEQDKIIDVKTDECRDLEHRFSSFVDYTVCNKTSKLILFEYLSRTPSCDKKRTYLPPGQTVEMKDAYVQTVQRYDTQLKLNTAKRGVQVSVFIGKYERDYSSEIILPIVNTTVIITQTHNDQQFNYEFIGTRLTAEEKREKERQKESKSEYVLKDGLENTHIDCCLIM